MFVVDILNNVFGFRDLTHSEIFAVALLALVVSTVLGWFTDAVMGEAGFGVTGNAILGLLSAIVGVVVITMVSVRVWHRYPQQSELLFVIAIATMFAVMSLLLLAALKKIVVRG